MSTAVKQMIAAAGRVEYYDLMAMRRHTELGKVYVVGFGPYVKIGFSAHSSHEKRVSELERGLPEPLTVFAVIDGTRYLEKSFHRHFKAYRTRGEWFRREGALADWLDMGCPTGSPTTWKRSQREPNGHEGAE